MRRLAGVPSEGPTLLVGYHMFLLTSFLEEKNIIVRGMAHPVLSYKPDGKQFPELSEFMYVLIGAMLVSGPNLFKLLASKSHVLLYPRGAREALHRKVQCSLLLYVAA